MLYHLKLKPLLLASDWLTRFFEVTLVRQKKRPGQVLWLRPEASSGLKSCLVLARAPHSHQHFASGQ
jgi:hypothetical protein